MARFSAAISALRSSQLALETVGNNIANANTPGYHRQSVRLGNVTPFQNGGLSIGQGVTATDIQRVRSRMLDLSLLNNTSELQTVESRLSGMRIVETSMAGGEFSPIDGLEEFFNQLEQLSIRPDDTPTRNVAISSARSFTDDFRTLSRDLESLLEQNAVAITNDIGRVNNLTVQIADLNAQVQRLELTGASANDLRDNRDRAISELAEFLNVTLIEEQNGGQTTVLADGVPLVLGGSNFELAASFDANGLVTVNSTEVTATVTVAEGELAGLTQLRNESIPRIRQQLDTLARETMRSMDKLHATGVGRAGAFTQLTSARTVEDITVPLADAELDFPPQAGSLFITVTETSTGKRTLHEVVIDPATQSLEGVATAISAVSNVQALANAEQGSVSILAANGFTFDFRDGFTTNPDTSGITGTATPEISGGYNSPENDRFDFSVVSAGEVGVTPGLTLEARNSQGDLIASLNIGQGYEPGSEIEVADGVQLSLSSGTLTGGDTFSTPVVSDADSAGLLTALGLNTFFVGGNAASIEIHPDLLAASDRLATSRTGHLGSSSNIQRMVDVRDSMTLDGGTETPQQFYASLVADIGAEVRSLSESQATLELLGERLASERESVSGVDPNEELIQMIRFQRMFEVASRYIASVNSTLDDLLQIV